MRSVSVVLSATCTFWLALGSAYAEGSAGAKAAPAATSVDSYEKSCRALIRAKGRQSESARLKTMFEAQWTYLMTTYPEWATHVGYPGQNRRWTDNSLEAIASRRRADGCLLDLVKSFDRMRLPSRDRFEYDLFRHRAERENEEWRFPNEYLIINQLGGVHQDVAQLFEAMPKATEADYRDILARLAGTPEVITQNLALLKQGLAKGITPAKIALREVPNQISAMIKDNPLESPWLSPFTQIPASIPAERAQQLREEAKRIYVDQVRPKLIELRSFITDVYLPGARESIAWRDLPDGEAWYALRVRDATTTRLTPQEIHDIGMKEVERIRGEMEKIMKEVKFKGSIAEFQQFLRKDKKFFHKSADELLREYRDIAKRADAELPKLFGYLPRLPYGVSPVPAYAEKSQPTAYYMGGSLKAGRAGVFFANTYDLKSRPRWEMEALTLHEAVPGHHLQIALAQEQETGPEFRKYDHHTAYVEGWGLYAESLGYEMGFYKDPYSRFGQLTYEMWRALRLVVDTGMHQLGWSRQRAIDFMRTHLAKAEHDIVVEIDRYIVWAGQATAYKIGQLKIRELRDKATVALGPTFDIRAFHDVVLGRGSVPLDVLEEIVDDFVADEKAKSHRDAKRTRNSKERRD